MARKNGATEPDSALRIFRVGAVLGVSLVILEGIAGPMLNGFLPFGLPLGTTPLAELGACMGLSYCVAEVFYSRRGNSQVK